MTLLAIVDGLCIDLLVSRSNGTSSEARGLLLNVVARVIVALAVTHRSRRRVGSPSATDCETSRCHSSNPDNPACALVVLARVMFCGCNHRTSRRPPCPKRTRADVSGPISGRDQAGGDEQGQG